MLTQNENKIARIRESILERLSAITDSLETIYGGAQNSDLPLLRKTQNILADFERENFEIDNMIIDALATIGAEGKDLRCLIAFLKITNETNRIASNARALSKKLAIYAEKNAIEDIKNYVIELCKCAINISKIAARSIEDEEEGEEGETYRKMSVEETKSDDLYALLEKKRAEEANGGERLSLETYQRLGAVRKLEKISDRFMAIAALIEFAKYGVKPNVVFQAYE